MRVVTASSPRETADSKLAPSEGPYNTVTVTRPITATLLCLLVALCQSWPLSCVCLWHCANHGHTPVSACVSACGTVPNMATLLSLYQSWPLSCVCLCHCADHGHYPVSACVSACGTVPIMANLLSLCQSWPFSCLCLWHCANHGHSPVSACGTVPWKVGCCCSEHISVGKTYVTQTLQPRCESPTTVTVCCDASIALFSL